MFSKCIVKPMLYGAKTYTVLNKKRTKILYV